MRFVFDTNLVISAILFADSKASRALRFAWRMGVILMSVDTLAELSEVLHRPKFNRYVLAEERELFLTALVKQVEFIEITTRFNTCRDPKDDKFLDLAVSGKADYLVSGHDDLLTLKTFHDVLIVTVNDFLNLLRYSDSHPK
ncbi:hypothetical protein BH10CHL1_BH10CHL1_19250 [soil metagenome]